MIIGVGCIAFDQILATNAKWKDEKGKIVRREFRFGGNVRNSLVAVASLGVKAAYVGTMSGEEKWKSALDDFKDNGVSTEFVDFSDKSHPAEATIVITGDGERFIVYDDTPLHHLGLPSEEKIEKAVAGADLLLVDAGICPPGTLDVIRRCADLKIPIILDAEQFFVKKEIILEMITLSTDLILPLNFARLLTDKDDISEVIDTLWNDSKNLVVITEGAKGCYFREKGSLVTQHMSAYEINAVDTNGTGDIFHGAYAYALLNGMKTIENLEFASAAAASVASLPHGSVRKPSLSVIKEFISSKPKLKCTSI
jgi:sugar/nucleoside kinase (ribokinase family)